jgi:hypothetical protein
VKVGVRLIGATFAHPEAAVESLRRRVLARLDAELAARAATRRIEQAQSLNRTPRPRS